MSAADSFLELAADPARPAEDRTADALTGILAAIVHERDKADELDMIHKLHDDADAALGRVLALAEDLDRQATPTATGSLLWSRWLVAAIAQRIRTAVYGPEAQA